MLPVTIRFLIAMIAYAINERMARRVDYLQEEVRVLREMLLAKTGRPWITFTDDQRLRLALKGTGATAVTFGGRRVSLSHPRVRARGKGRGGEVTLPTIDFVAQEN
jgi:hypothetical protein